MNFKHYFQTVITMLIVSLSICACNEEQGPVNDKEGQCLDVLPAFAEMETLDCRNLIIRDVVLKGDIVEVTLENTCKSCDDDWVYLDMVMIDRTSVPQDTLAQTPCFFCELGPANGTSMKYQLNIVENMTTLPDLRSLKFNFGYLCTDVTVLKE